MIFAMLCLMGKNWKSHWKSEMLNESSQSAVASVPSSAGTGGINYGPLSLTGVPQGKKVYFGSWF